MPTETSSIGDRDGEPLRATLAIDLGTAIDCPVAREAPNASAVDQTLSCRPNDCRTCQAELTVRTDGIPKTTRVTTEIDADCLCPQIADLGCVFTLESVRDGDLVVSVVVRDRGRIADVVETIREAGASVRLERIVRVDGPGLGSGTAEDGTDIDLHALTEKQREAVELAVELGYYEQPRRTDLQALADRLGVSRSAVSQRLTAVESMVVRSLVSE